MSYGAHWSINQIAKFSEMQDVILIGQFVHDICSIMETVENY